MLNNEPANSTAQGGLTRPARGRLFPAIVAVLDWLCLAIIVAAVLVFLWAMCGCASWGDRVRDMAESAHIGNAIDPMTARQEAAAGLRSAASFCGWVGKLALVASIVLLAVSFTPWGAIVPRISPMMGAAAAGGCWLLQYALLAYGVLFAELAVWIGLAAGVGTGVAAAWPYITTYKAWMLKRRAALLAPDHPDAATALEVVAMPRAFPTPEARKARRARLELIKETRPN